MSKAEIQSWTAAAGGSGGDEEPTVSFRWDSLNEDSNWPSFLDYAKAQLLTSSTKTRIEFFTNRLSPLAARGGTQHQSHRQGFDGLSNHTTDGADMGYFPSADVNISSLCGDCILSVPFPNATFTVKLRPGWRF
jgi:hypothetical protein